MHGNGGGGRSQVVDVLVDALLAGASSVVGLLAGMTFLGVKADPGGVVFVLVIAFSTAFVSSMQAARGRGTAKLPPEGRELEDREERDRNG